MIDTVQMDIRASLSMLTPMDVVGSSKIRVGGLADGGYVMIDQFPAEPVCYSIGVGPDVSWDIDMAANRGGTVHQYDHTVESVPADHAQCHFNKIGLSDSDGEAHMARLDTLITDHGNADRRDLILKCDIEGAEWTALGCLEPGYFMRFDQIVMELHWLDHLHSADFRAAWMRLIGNISSTHQSIHIHGNNYSDIIVTAGVPIPQVVEVSFARRFGRTFAESKQMIPGPLDSKNRFDAPDLFLGLFRF